jgi:hypothetical protein
MDSSISVNGLSRKLYSRGAHRLLGNPFLGTLAAFLSVLLLIRIAANFYMTISISTTNPNIDAVQMASAHFVFLSAYAVWVGTLRSCRIGMALPRICSVAFALQGRRFRSMFFRRNTLRSATNAASLSAMLLTVFIFSLLSGSWCVILFRFAIVFSATAAAVIVVTALASRSVLSRPETQIMEILYLLVLVVLNPDLGSTNRVLSISFFFGSLRHTFSSPWQVVSAVGLIVVVALLLLVIVRVLEGVKDLFGRQRSLNPMDRWYWRFLRIRSWVFLYVVVTPVFLSSTIVPSIKRWVLILSILFGVGSYLHFVSHCENTLRDKWRRSLFEEGNLRLARRSILNHVILMSIPVLVYVVFR